MDDAVEQFGKNVRVARDKLAWTQEELADKSGLSAVQVSRVERGAREIRLTTLLRLVAALGATPNDLLSDLVRDIK